MSISTFPQPYAHLPPFAPFPATVYGLPSFLLHRPTVLLVSKCRRIHHLQNLVTPNPSAFQNVKGARCRTLANEDSVDDNAMHQICQHQSASSCRMRTTTRTSRYGHFLREATTSSSIPVPANESCAKREETGERGVNGGGACTSQPFPSQS